MVLVEQPRIPATASIPPCPSRTASTAAYRRRSFSDSESKYRFMCPRACPSHDTIAAHAILGSLLKNMTSEVQPKYTNPPIQATLIVRAVLSWNGMIETL